MTGTDRATDSALPSTIESSDPARLVCDPLVSVMMITYNHAPFIGEAIESVLSQTCDFAFELVIGEDASTDGTLAVALDYHRRQPDNIRVLHAARNIGIAANSRRVLESARGEFIAFCEGDDYWCSRRKLALQVQRLREIPSAAVVHSDWVRAKEDGGAWTIDWHKTMHRRVPRRFLEGNLFPTFHYPKILRTCTTLHRRAPLIEVLATDLWAGRYPFRDTIRTVYETSKWSVAYLPAVTAVYRESPNSVLRSGREARLRFLKASLDFDTHARRFFRDRSDYPDGYRWELSVGLLFKALRLRRFDDVRFAWRDIRAHFGVRRFVRTFIDTLAMRKPTLVAQHHGVP
jgi:glycosyltransferase involved in cell wall biosynthesis